MPNRQPPWTRPEEEDAVERFLDWCLLIALLLVALVVIAVKSGAV